MKTFRFLSKYVRNYIWILIIVALSIVFMVCIELIGPWIIKTMIAVVRTHTPGQANSGIITRLALLALGVYALRWGLHFLRSYMAHIAGWGVVADVRSHIYSHLQKLSLGFYADKQTGSLMSQTINDSDMFERLIAHAIPDIAVNLLTLIGVSCVLFSMNWHLALYSFIPIPFIIVGMRIFAKYVRPAFVIRQKELGELNAVLNDNISGIREIQAFTREETEAAHINKHIERYRISMLKVLKLMATFHPFVAFFSSLGFVIVIYFGGRLAFQQILPIEDLVAFFLYLNIFYHPVAIMSNAWEGIQEAVAGAERVAELLDEQPDVKERSRAVQLPDEISGTITFNDVSFWYSRGDRVLENINLKIPANSVVALVGPTGVGKTTLASLIPRFYDVCKGSILIDDMDIRDIKLKSLRQKISIVSQDVFLFHGTARENILFGCAEANEDTVTGAAEIANAHDFIVELPDGYDTLIGERGIKLSGGQKQRLAIARAVLKDAPILILDEATSSVDTETELLIQQALERLMKSRTAIIIAHRLSTIRNADIIVVLEGNHISQIGSHKELMRQKGLYRHLNEVQMDLRA